MKAYKGILVACVALVVCFFMAGCTKADMKPDSVKKAPQEMIEAPRLAVMGIVYSEDRRYAVIGEQLLQEGDEILGATVATINRDNVVFEKDGERWTQEVEGKEKETEIAP